MAEAQKPEVWGLGTPLPASHSARGGSVAPRLLARVLAESILQVKRFKSLKDNRKGVWGVGESLKGVSVALSSMPHSQVYSLALHMVPRAPQG